jgi:hypothetical protein
VGAPGHPYALLSPPFRLAAARTGAAGWPAGGELAPAGRPPSGGSRRSPGSRGRGRGPRRRWRPCGSPRRCPCAAPGRRGRRGRCSSATSCSRRCASPRAARSSRAVHPCARPPEQRQPAPSWGAPPRVAAARRGVLHRVRGKEPSDPRRPRRGGVRRLARVARRSARARSTPGGRDADRSAGPTRKPPRTARRASTGTARGQRRRMVAPTVPRPPCSTDAPPGPPGRPRAGIPVPAASCPLARRGAHAQDSPFILGV